MFHNEYVIFCVYMITNFQTEATKAFWILYNDDPPNKFPKWKYGHTKGAVIANMQQGFWLIHSVPNYPPVPNSGNDIRRVCSIILNTSEYRD